jgi:Rrf2 family protein
MKLSAKVRYALAATIRMAQLYDVKESVTLVSLSEDLAISKIYLEQIFSLLKRGEIVSSIKGARGGYLLSRPPKDISVLDIVASVETSLFAKNEKTVPDNAYGIDETLRQVVFQKIHDVLTSTLLDIDLAQLVTESERRNSNQDYMYYL